jgi:DNA-binding NarL/FixJ family response regulator
MFNCFRSYSSKIPIISLTECANVFGHKLSSALGIKAYCLTSIETSELARVVKDNTLTETYIQLACREKIKQQLLFLQKYELKDRQLDVLSLMVLGLSNEEISSLLHISYDTVRSHMKIILERLGARDRARAISMVFHDILIECAQNNKNEQHPFY